MLGIQNQLGNGLKMVSKIFREWSKSDRSEKVDCKSSILRMILRKQSTEEITQLFVIQFLVQLLKTHVFR